MCPNGGDYEDGRETKGLRTIIYGGMNASIFFSFGTVKYAHQSSVGINVLCMQQKAGCLEKSTLKNGSPPPPTTLKSALPPPPPTFKNVLPPPDNAELVYASSIAWSLIILSSCDQSKLTSVQVQSLENKTQLCRFESA